MKKVTVNDIVSTLAAYDIKVRVQPTFDLFPDRELDLNHYSVVCGNEQDQIRVYHWIQFMTPLFDNFNAWAVLITAIEPTGKY